MATPKVIFANKFIYKWHIGSGDLLDYYRRPQAFEKSTSLLNIESDEYDFISYMQNDEKSDGCFSSLSDKMSDEEIESIRKLERHSQAEGCPKYVQVISFDNSFLIENGLVAGGNVDLSELKNITRKAINTLINNEPKFDKDNVYWCGAIHVNTDNIHIHTSLLEKERRENRLTKYKDKDMISVDAFDKLKSSIVSSIAKKSEQTSELTKIEREILLPKLQEKFTNTTAQMQHLLAILPKGEGWQYNRPKMKPFKIEINKCVDNIIQSNSELRSVFDNYLEKINAASEVYKEIYGSGNRYKYLRYKNTKLEEFYSRAGNKLLKELARINKSYDDDEDENKTQKGFALPKSAKTDFINGIQALKTLEFEEAEKLLKKSNEKGYAPANYQLGLLYLKHQEFFPDTLDKALTIIDSEAECGNISANYHLGMFYQHRNPTLAENYLLEAAHKNHSSAQYQLALLYLSEKEKNVSHDTFTQTKQYKKGMHWLEQSALQNNSKAQARLGIELLKVDSQKEKGIEYLKKSASQNNEFARGIIKHLKEQQTEFKFKSTKSQCNYRISSSLSALKRLYNEYENHTKQLINQFDYEFEQQIADDSYIYERGY